METQMFDWDTARPMDVRPRRNRHFFFQDAHGSICLAVLGALSDGGKAGRVPIMPAAIEMLDQMAGARFIRIINERAQVDVIAPRGDVRLGGLDRLWNHWRYMVGPDGFPDGTQTPTAVNDDGDDGHSEPQVPHLRLVSDSESPGENAPVPAA